MKTLKLFLALMLLTQTAFAEPEPPKSDVELIIRAMAEQYAKSAAQDLAIQELKTQAAKALGEHMATQLGDAAFNILAIVGLVQNVQAYDQATTEGGKYSAAAHTAANAISIAFAPIPIVGLMVNLSVLGQDLMAAFISKDFILEQARMRAEISRIYKETSDIQLKQYNAELNAMTALTTRLGVITLLGEQSAEQHAKNCVKDDFDFKTPEACLISLLTLEQLISKQLHTIGMILNFKGRFLNFYSLDMNSKTMQELYKKAEAQLKEISSSIRYALNQVVFNQIWDLKNQQEREMISRRCEVAMIIKLKQITLEKKEALQSKEDNIWELADVEEKKMELQILIDGVCSDYFKTAPANIKEIARTALGSRQP